MVFQGTLLPAIGIMLTPWEPRIEVVTGVADHARRGGVAALQLRERGLPVGALLVCGVLYVTYLAITLSR